MLHVGFDVDEQIADLQIPEPPAPNEVDAAAEIPAVRDRVPRLNRWLQSKERRKQKFYGH